MHNPIYVDDFKCFPETETVQSLSFLHEKIEVPEMVLKVGIKKITHDRRGLKLFPFDTIVIEIREGSELASFNLPPDMAKTIGAHLIKLANKTNGE